MIQNRPISPSLLQALLADDPADRRPCCLTSSRSMLILGKGSLTLPLNGI
jgi:hypothetical protein